MAVSKAGISACCTADVIAANTGYRRQYQVAVDWQELWAATDLVHHGACLPMSINRQEIVVESNFTHFGAQFDPFCNGVPEMKPDVDARVAVFFRGFGEACE